MSSTILFIVLKTHIWYTINSDSRGGSMLGQIKEFFCAPFRLVKPKWSILISEYASSITAHVLELLLPLAVSMIIKYATEMNASSAFLWCGILAVVYCMIDTLWWLNYRAYDKNSIHFQLKLYDKYLNKLATVDDDFGYSVSHGQLYKIVNSDTVDVPLYIDSIFEVINSSTKGILVMWIMLRVNFLLGAILSISGIIYYLYINYNDIHFVNHFRNQKKADDAISNVFLEVLNGLREVKTLDIEKKLRGHYENQRRRYTKEYRKKRIYHVRMQSTCEGIVQITKLLMYGVMAVLILNQKLGIEMLVLFIGYYENLIKEVDDLTDNASEARQYRVAIDRIHMILDYKEKKHVEIGVLDNTEIYGNLSFHKVSFGYRNNVLFKNASFQVKPHTINAIVGLSGSGKTTLINLLLRKYKVQEGNILMDGTSIYEYSEDAYLSNITAISQNPFIFQMSIRENLNMVTTNRQKQEAVCRRVGIHDFIMSLPKGYNTVLAENATNVSGGQKQLLSIARALLTESEILLFDEITSSLDPTNVKNIASIVRDLKKDHTVLIVTNKPVIMDLAEQILFIKRKKIYSYETYQQLVLKHPDFKLMGEKEKEAIE